MADNPFLVAFASAVDKYIINTGVIPTLQAIFIASWKIVTARYYERLHICLFGFRAAFVTN